MEVAVDQNYIFQNRTLTQTPHGSTFTEDIFNQTTEVKAGKENPQGTLF